MSALVIVVVTVMVVGAALAPVAHQQEINRFPPTTIAMIAATIAIPATAATATTA